MEYEYTLDIYVIIYVILPGQYDTHAKTFDQDSFLFWQVIRPQPHIPCWLWVQSRRLRMTIMIEG